MHDAWSSSPQRYAKLVAHVKEEALEAGMLNGCALRSRFTATTAVTSTHPK